MPRVDSDDDEALDLLSAWLNEKADITSSRTRCDFTSSFTSSLYLRVLIVSYIRSHSFALLICTLFRELLETDDFFLLCDEHPH